MPNFSKRNEGRTGNSTAHGMLHSMQHSISYANTGNSTVSSTPDSTSNIFQILQDIWKRQRAVQCQYNSSMVPTVPEMETPFRTTTPSTPAMRVMTANGRTSVNRLSLMKQDILSHYSGCFEGIGHFLGEPYTFHLKPEHKPARHAPMKVPIHLEAAFKEEIKSLVKLGILEEVKEHTHWVNSYVIVENDSGNHHYPNHTIKRKLRIVWMLGT